MDDQLLKYVTHLLEYGAIPHVEHLDTNVDQDVEKAEADYDRFVEESFPDDVLKQDAANCWGLNLSSAHCEQGVQDGFCMGVMLMLEVLQRSKEHFNRII